MRGLVVCVVFVVLMAGCTGGTSKPTTHKSSAKATSAARGPSAAQTPSVPQWPVDWPTYQHDGSRSGGIGTGPGTAWHHRVDSTTGSNHAGAVAVVHGLAIAATFDAALTALNSSTGLLVWQRQLSRLSFDSVAVAGPTLYFVEPGSPGTLVALDALSGAVKCTLAVGSLPQATPVVADGIVYVQSDGLRAVAADSCTQVWKASLDSHGGTPAVANGTLVAVDNTAAVALDATTGERKWRTPLDQPTYFVPVLPVKNLMVVASFGGLLYGLDRSTGAVAWTATLPAKAGGTSTDGIRVYVATEDGSVVALDAATGRTAWTKHLDQSASSVSVGNGKVFVAAGDLHALAADTGAPVWVADGYARSSPSVAGGTVYVNGDTEIRAVSASTGR